MSTKSTLRSDKIAMRSALPEDAARQAAIQASELAMQLLGTVRGKTISLYMPVRGELDTSPLAQRLRMAGALLALPRVEDSTAMSFRAWRSGDVLAEGYGGIREPGPDMLEVTPDAAIVPLAAFDRRGFRIGYGKGHYDRALTPKMFKLGYGFALQEVPEIPREAHDVALDAVVTETGIIVCNPARDGV